MNENVVSPRGQTGPYYSSSESTLEFWTLSHRNKRVWERAVIFLISVNSAPRNHQPLRRIWCHEGAGHPNVMETRSIRHNLESMVALIKPCHLTLPWKRQKRISSRKGPATLIGPLALEAFEITIDLLPVNNFAAGTASMREVHLPMNFCSLTREMTHCWMIRSLKDAKLWTLEGGREKVCRRESQLRPRKISN